MTLRIENLYVKYSEEIRWQIDKLSLILEKGGCLGIIASNGNGKTTLAYGIVGIIPEIFKGTVKGKVVLDEIEYSSVSLGERIRNISYVFQDIESQTLFGTISNIFGLNESDEKQNLVKDCIRYFELEKYLDRTPNTLSSGELQKVVLVASLRNNPRLLIYDEVTSVLDPIMKGKFLGYIQKLKENGITTILLGQRLNLVSKYTNNVLQIKDGVLSPVNIEENVQSVAIKKIYREPDRKFDIQIDRIVYRAPGGQFCLNVEELKLQEGQNIALVGTNGSGKTTFINILYGFIKAHEFEIHIDGKRYTNHKKSPINNIVDIVLHNTNSQILASKTEEIFRHLDVEKRALENIIPFIDYEKDPLTMSFGQIKVVTCIASFLSRNPVICIDEPEYGLDEYNYSIIQSYLKMNKEKKGKTILFATHDIEMAKKHADKIVVFSEGYIIAELNPEDFYKIERLIEEK